MRKLTLEELDLVYGGAPNGGIIGSIAVNIAANIIYDTGKWAIRKYVNWATTPGADWNAFAASVGYYE